MNKDEIIKLFMAAGYVLADDFVCTSKLRWHGGFVVGDKHILQQLWRSSRGFEEWRDIPIYNAPISERPNWLRKV